MARGWESKSVEEQQDVGIDVPRRKERSAAEIVREDKLTSLERSRRRVKTDLDTATTDTHRTALKHALDHLDGEIGKLHPR